MGTNPPAYSIGETVEVLYSAADPQQARINGFFDLWGWPVFMAGMGLPLFSIGVLVFLFGGQKRRKKGYL